MKTEMGKGPVTIFESFFRLVHLVTMIVASILVAYGVMYLAAQVVPDRLLRSILLHYGTAVLSIGILVLLGNFYVYHGFGHQADIYRRGDIGRKAVALTFDDGPNPRYTPSILQVLTRYEVTATFFLLGSQVEEYPVLAERIVEDGHEVGIHSFDHFNLPALSTAALSAQILQTIMAILNAGGRYPRFMRPPRGLYNGQLRRLTELLGIRIVLWSLSSEDWMPGKSGEAVAQRVLVRVQPGDILLFHDGGGLIGSREDCRDATVEALPIIIKGLKEQGYEILPLDELLGGATPEEEGQGQMSFSHS